MPLSSALRAISVILWVANIRDNPLSGYPLNTTTFLYLVGASYLCLGE